MHSSEARALFYFFRTPFDLKAIEKTQRGDEFPYYLLRGEVIRDSRHCVATSSYFHRGLDAPRWLSFLSSTKHATRRIILTSVNSSTKTLFPQKNVPLGDAEENEDGLNFKMVLSVCNDVQLF